MFDLQIAMVLSDFVFFILHKKMNVPRSGRSCAKEEQRNVRHILHIHFVSIILLIHRDFTTGN